MPPIDRARYREAAEAASADFFPGAQFGPNTSPRVIAARSARDEPSLLIMTAAGFTAELLIGSGLDIGRTTFEGHAISWNSPLDAAWPTVFAPQTDWLQRWHGGLITTCGLRNVGAPSEGFGLHGDFIFRTAADTRVEHTQVDGRRAVRIRGRIADAPALGVPLELERTIVIFDDAPEIRVDDVLRNLSDTRECAPMLYHVNLGSPFLTPDTRVEGVAFLETRDENSAWLEGWPQMGRPAPGETELVAEASLTRPGHADVVNHAAGVRLHLTWSGASMPRMHLWRRRRADAYVLALEPATGSLRGRGHEISEGSSMLDAHAERHTSIHLLLSHEEHDTNGDDHR